MSGRGGIRIPGKTDGRDGSPAPVITKVLWSLKFCVSLGVDARNHGPQHPKKQLPAAVPWDPATSPTHMPAPLPSAATATGPSRLRQRQMRNMVTALMVAHGVPMIQMGDEYGHSKVGARADVQCVDVFVCACQACYVSVCAHMWALDSMYARAPVGACMRLHRCLGMLSRVGAVAPARVCGCTYRGLRWFCRAGCMRCHRVRVSRVSVCRRLARRGQAPGPKRGSRIA